MSRALLLMLSRSSLGVLTYVNSSGATAATASRSDRACTPSCKPTLQLDEAYVLPGRVPLAW